MKDVYILDAVRTPIGKFAGALAKVRPDDLAAAVLRSVLDRNPTLDTASIDDVIFGNANGAGEENRNVARMGLLLAGYPTSVPGATVNRLCGSGMEAVVEASRAIAIGDARTFIAGGVESMSRAPWVMQKPEAGFPRTDTTLYSTTLGWRMVNPLMPKNWTVSLGEGAEILADKYSISREDQDQFAFDSHQNAMTAWDNGAFEDEISLVEGAALQRDESIRADATLERLATLNAAFRPEGTVTAGNSSPINDGAAALLLADADSMDEIGKPPLARVVSRVVTAVEPQLYGIGPVEAARTALVRAGISWSDLVAVELNEAFAAQSLACLSQWPELDTKIVNSLGGALAIGHPLGCSGARILTTLAWRLRRLGGGFGLAAMCIGVGQGIAVVLEA